MPVWTSCNGTKPSGIKQFLVPSNDFPCRNVMSRRNTRQKFRSKLLATGKARNSSIDVVRQAEYRIAVSSCSASEIEFQTA